MFPTSRLALVCSSALLATACGGSSGGGSDAASQLEVQELRNELFAAGIQPLPDPPPVSDELVALGQALFFDKVLSGNEDVSCATCHLPEFSSGDGRTLSSGVGGIGFGPNRGGGAIVGRNSPSLFALHLKDGLFWDGRVEAVPSGIRMPANVVLSVAMQATFSPGLEVLAAQAMLPPASNEEMRGFIGENELGTFDPGYEGTVEVGQVLIERLLDLPGYVALLQAAYPQARIEDFNFAHATNAIAAFEVRAFARTDSPFERFVRGDDQALTSTQIKGAVQFFSTAGCARCHTGSTFTDQQYHNTGLPQIGPGASANGPPLNPFSDFGRLGVTGEASDRFLFHTPSLLNVELTGPYGHAGQFERLRDMVAHYEDPALSLAQYDIQSNVMDPALTMMPMLYSPFVLETLDPRLDTPNDFDVDAVVEFLRALTAEDARDLSDVVPTSVPSGLPVF